MAVCVLASAALSISGMAARGPLLLAAASLGLATVASRHHRDAAHNTGLHRVLRARGHDLDELIAAAAPTEAFFAQRLDHFDHQEPGVRWQQRYQVNETFYTKDGPVFLLLGGEGPASPVWLAADTAPMVYAREHGAAVYQLEHRFYGKSQPFVDLSTEHLQEYLTSRQALADAAEFVSSVILPKHGEATKVISFGGSYSGALSAWLRQTYPKIIHAAVSTSSPILAQVSLSLSPSPSLSLCVNDTRRPGELQGIPRGRAGLALYRS